MAQDVRFSKKPAATVRQGGKKKTSLDRLLPGSSAEKPNPNRAKKKKTSNTFSGLAGRG